MSVKIVQEPPRPAKPLYVEYRSSDNSRGDSIQCVRITENEIHFLSGLVEITPGYCGHGGKFFVDRALLRELCKKITEFLDEKENN